MQYCRWCQSPVEDLVEHLANCEAFKAHARLMIRTDFNPPRSAIELLRLGWISISALERLSGRKHPMLQQFLQRLKQRGCLEEKKVGATTLYKLIQEPPPTLSELQKHIIKALKQIGGYGTTHEIWRQLKLNGINTTKQVVYNTLRALKLKGKIARKLKKYNKREYVWYLRNPQTINHLPNHLLTEPEN